MPRQISVSYRESVEAQASGDVDLIFVTITNEDLVTPIRVVSDTVGYTYDGNSWTGMPFDIMLLTDDDSPPKAQLQIENVDQIIGHAAASIQTACRLRIQLLCSADFDLNVRPRVALPAVTPAVEYDASALFLINVRVDAMQISGDITGWDYLQRVWPGRRATKDALPGLFR